MAFTPTPGHKKVFKMLQIRMRAEPQPYPPDSALEAVSERAERYNAEAVSAWARAVKELAAERVITLVQPPARPAEIPDNFADTINSMSSTELRIKLNRDPAFAELYGRWAALPPSPPKPVTLTVEQYRATPSAEIQRRYRNEPLYKAAVDRLHASGQV
jgi:hypothetical protein